MVQVVHIPLNDTVLGRARYYHDLATFSRKCIIGKSRKSSKTLVDIGEVLVFKYYIGDMCFALVKYSSVAFVVG